MSASTSMRMMPGGISRDAGGSLHPGKFPVQDRFEVLSTWNPTLCQSAPSQGQHREGGHRVMQVVYSFERGKLPVYPGQIMDVYIDDRTRRSSQPPASARRGTRNEKKRDRSPGTAFLALGCFSVGPDYHRKDPAVPNRFGSVDQDITTSGAVGWSSSVRGGRSSRTLS